MFEQLYGVLREVVSLDTDEPKPATSERFLGDGLLEANDDAIWKPIAASLPRTRPDPDDSAAGAIMASAGLRPDKLKPYLDALRQQFPRSNALTYAELDLAVSQGDYATATQLAEALLQANPYDWKAWFLQGRIAFLMRDPKLAAEKFARIRAELPGEPAAQLALALALEALGEPAAAEPIYDRVSKADPSYASAAFGLARCRLAGMTIGPKERDSAAQALARIPATSALYVASRMAITRVLISDPPGRVSQPHGLEELRRAAEVLGELALDTRDSHLLAADLLVKAADQVSIGASPDAKMLGCAETPRDLRLGAERELRRAARLESDPHAMIVLVDRANQARPRTLF
jgi:serine/threonine-protein kinase PknG